MAAPSFPKMPVPALAAALILLNAPGQLHEALHGYADFGDDRADDNKERADGGNYKANGDDGLFLAFIHAVELIDKALNMADDAPDGRHQDFTKGDGKLLQLGFQDGQLNRQGCPAWSPP